MKTVQNLKIKIEENKSVSRATRFRRSDIYVCMNNKDVKGMLLIQMNRAQGGLRERHIYMCNSDTFLYAQKRCYHNRFCITASSSTTYRISSCEY